MKKVLFTLALAFGTYTFSQAQVIGGTREATQSVSLLLEQVLNVAISSNNLTQFVFDQIPEYDNGITQSAATTFQVGATVPWKLTVNSDAVNFQSSSGTTMPLSVLSLRKTGGTYSPLTTAASPTQLNSGIRGAITEVGNSFTVDFKAAPGYIYNPATYTIGLVYTVSAL